jgi:hypothetical protein
MVERPWLRLGEERELAEGGSWHQVGGLEPLEVLVQFRQEENGRKVVDAVLIKSERVSAEQLRDVPLGQIERLANAKPDMEVERFFRELRPLERYRHESAEYFAAKVATYYHMFSARHASPAKAISEHAGVPVGTVRWWIREARRLGKLPAGQRGKVG